MRLGHGTGGRGGGGDDDEWLAASRLMTVARLMVRRRRRRAAACRGVRLWTGWTRRRLSDCRWMGRLRVITSRNEGCRSLFSHRPARWIQECYSARQATMSVGLRMMDDVADSLPAVGMQLFLVRGRGAALAGAMELNPILLLQFRDVAENKDYDSGKALACLSS